MKHQLLIVLSAVALATTASIATAGGDVAAGKAKAGMCAGCHGGAGVSAVPTYPNLAGQKSAYTAKQLKAFKAGTRKDPMMGGLAKSLSDADIANLAAYYESLK